MSENICILIVGCFLNSNLIYLTEFCTPWPEGLETEDAIRKHFPLEVISNEYLHSSPSIRDFRTRIVTVRVSTFRALVYLKLRK